MANVQVILPAAYLLPEAIRENLCRAPKCLREQTPPHISGNRVHADYNEGKRPSAVALQIHYAGRVGNWRGLSTAKMTPRSVIRDVVDHRFHGAAVFRWTKRGAPSSGLPTVQPSGAAIGLSCCFGIS